jgi:hypothetical protein
MTEYIVTFVTGTDITLQNTVFYASSNDHENNTREKDEQAIREHAEKMGMIVKDIKLSSE